MEGHLFVSYSRIDGGEFALRLADELEAGPPSFAAWVDVREMQPGREDWDRQLVEAIKTCTAVLFVMTEDSVRDESGCKPEWVAGLRYKKPIVPVLAHSGAELPFRLSSRQFIDFSDSFDVGLAQLRRHLSWRDTPAGVLQDLRHRLADAEYELPRVASAQRPRIDEEIGELRRRIDEQQQVVQSPQIAAEQTGARIGAAMEREREPERPVVAPARAKFVNPPPMTAPTYFQNRHVETELTATFLREDGMRMLWLVGRGGVGKTAMVCRLLKALEAEQLPDELGELTVEGIVYLSPLGHPVNFPNLFSDLCRLLPEDVAGVLLARYRDPQETPAGLMRALLDVFPAGRTVVLLDNFEELVDAEARGLTDAALDEALRALLSAPVHGVKVIITTRVAPRDLLLRHPESQRRRDFDEGLPSPFAEEVLRARDPDGRLGVKHAPDELLAEAQKRTRGFPRALEALVAILAADRATTLPELLAATRGMPENVVEVLVGEAFSRLDGLSQQVMQALAIYASPVSPVAVDYLLQPFQPAIDSTPVLTRLVNMSFVRRDAGHYYLHQVDRDYALQRAPLGDASDYDADPLPFTQYALRHHGADYFEQTRTPRETWHNLDDLAPQLAEFELRCQTAEYDTAAQVVLDIDFDYLILWGHYRLVLELHNRLQDHLTDPSTDAASKSNLGLCYATLGETRHAIELHEQALTIDREIGSHQGESNDLASLGRCYAALGETRRAIELHEQALTIDREIGDRQGESNDLASLGLCYAALGETRRAIELHEQALTIDREIGDRQGESADLTSLGGCYAALGETRRAIELHEQALTIDREIGDRQGESANLTSLGGCYAALGETRRAIELHEQALTIDREIGDRQGESANLTSLGRCYAALGETRRAIELHEQALTIDREIGDRQGESANLTSLGGCYATLGETRRAIELHEQALTIDREIGSRQGESNDLASLGGCYAALGETRRAIELHEQALTIDREIGSRQGESNDLASLGLCYAALGETRRAIELHEQALTINREIGNRQGESVDLTNLGDCYADLGAWQQAAQYCEQAIQIADEIDFAQVRNEGRLSLATAQLHAGELDAALQTVQRIPSDYPPTAADLALIAGIALTRQDKRDAAHLAFTDAVRFADAVLEHTNDNHHALDTKALALCGLLADDIDQLTEKACSMFRTARAITRDKGTIERVLRLFDALAMADATRILEPIRHAAAGHQD